MADGRVLDLNGKQLYQVVNGRKASSTQLSSLGEGIVGAQLPDGKSCLSGKPDLESRSNPVAGNRSGSLFMEISSKQRKALLL